MTVPVLTRDQAGAAVRAAVAERDAIQANLLELDSSFGKQLLAGAQLTGDTKRRWDATAATLATLWQVYSAYSAVVDQAAEAVTRHLGSRELAAVTALLTGRSVQLASGPAPLAGRDLADSGREDLTLASAVARMRGAFAAVTEVVAAAEHVWTEVAGRLDAAARELARVAPQAETLGDESLTDLAAVQGRLTRLRDMLNSDPLALWLGSPAPGSAAVDTSGADRLQEEVAAVATRVDKLVRLRDDARQRIAGVAAAAATARSAREDAVAAWQQAAAKIAAGALPPQPDSLAGLSARLAGLGRCWPAAGGPAWGLSWICSTASCPPRRPASRRPNGPWWQPWPNVTSCAACSAPIRPRPPGLARSKTPAWPNGMTGLVTCSGWRPVTWPRPRPRWPATSRPCWRCNRGDLHSAGLPDRTCCRGPRNPAPALT